MIVISEVGLVCCSMFKINTSNANTVHVFLLFVLELMSESSLQGIYCDFPHTLAEKRGWDLLKLAIVMGKKQSWEVSNMAKVMNL